MAKTKLNITKSFRGQDMKAIKQICDAVSYSIIQSSKLRLTIITLSLRLEKNTVF
jgi:hypothetical protein